MGRTIDICESCGAEKEIVSRGLCHNCNMQRDREEKAALRGQADKHSSAQRKAQKRLDAGLVKMMKLLNDFEASGLVAVEDINTARLAIKPYVDRIGDGLEPQEDREARERLDAALEGARNGVAGCDGNEVSGEAVHWGAQPAGNGITRRCTRRTSEHGTYKCE
jgi:hypothetical protein